MSESPPRPSTTDSPADEPAQPVPQDNDGGPSFVSLLYNHNPFYVISAMLMLYAVRSIYGELHIGTINCWLMMGVLAGYTLLLAAIGVVIVRWGKVWEDARSIFVIVLLLFLAVSVSADDLFANMESETAAVVLLLCGYLFSAIVTELVLRGARLDMGLLYRVPLHLMLALFYVAPWFCASVLDATRQTELQWRILTFPVATAALLLSLVPAVRRGPGYVAENGSPWRWPLYPWVAFGAIIVAAGLRTFALSMTFGPTGPIWIQLPASSGGGRAISFDTMWGPYFLIPILFAVLILFLEAGLSTGNRRQVRRVLWSAPGLLLLAVPWSSGHVHWGFLRLVVDSIGSPLSLTVWLLAALYGWAWRRGVGDARWGVLGSLSLLIGVNAETIRPQDVGDPQLWVLLGVGLAVLIEGVRARSSRTCFAAALLGAWALWESLPDTPLAQYRAMTTYHVLWAAAIVLGLVLRDRFSTFLRATGALQMPIAALLVVVGPWSSGVPLIWRGSYVLALMAASILIAQIWKSRWYLYAFTSLMAISAYGFALSGFRHTVQLLGRAATMALGWSVGTLLTAILISVHKAGWFPKRLFPRWRNGHEPPPAPELIGPSPPSNT